MGGGGWGGGVWEDVREGGDGECDERLHMCTIRKRVI